MASHRNLRARMMKRLHCLLDPNLTNLLCKLPATGVIKLTMSAKTFPQHLLILVLYKKTLPKADNRRCSRERGSKVNLYHHYDRNQARARLDQSTSQPVLLPEPVVLPVGFGPGPLQTLLIRYSIFGPSMVMRTLPDATKTPCSKALYRRDPVSKDTVVTL